MRTRPVDDDVVERVQEGADSPGPLGVGPVSSRAVPPGADLGDDDFDSILPDPFRELDGMLAPDRWLMPVTVFEAGQERQFRGRWGPLFAPHCLTARFALLRLLLFLYLVVLR